MHAVRPKVGRLRAVVLAGLVLATLVVWHYTSSLLDLKWTGPLLPDRASAAIDTFATFANASSCGISSLDLHLPFGPRCTSVSTVLEAMSGGGRAGYDAPYIPRGCDMTWYTAPQVCEVLGRFERVLFIGDSLMRNIVQMLYIHLRRDMAFGGMPEWRLNLTMDTRTETIEDCRCGKQVEVSGCSQNPIIDSQWLAPANTTSTIQCPQSMARITYHKVLDWPIVESNISDVLSQLPSSAPSKGFAVIMNNAWWNSVLANESTSWLSQLDTAMLQRAPWMGKTARHGRLFVGVTAGNRDLNQELFTTREHYRVAAWEHEMREASRSRGFDFLGLFNASVQSTQTDQAHATLPFNLLKFQMVMNWLDMTSSA